jgi:hypothetical protein
MSFYFPHYHRISPLSRLELGFTTHAAMLIQHMLVCVLSIPIMSFVSLLSLGPRLRGCLIRVLKFNKYCSTFVLFDKKFLILD